MEQLLHGQAQLYIRKNKNQLVWGHLAFFVWKKKSGIWKRF